VKIVNKDYHMMKSINVRLGCYAQKLKEKQAWRCKQKLKDIGNVDPYTSSMPPMMEFQV
jgi:hypothetical protein